MCAADLDGNGSADALGASRFDHTLSWFPSTGFTDCNLNGLADSFEISTGLESDCDGDGVLDACQINADPSLDANTNGVLDSCDLTIGTSYCGPAVPNSTGRSGELRVFGSDTVFLNDVQITGAQLPLQSFGFFITSQTQGYVPIVNNSQGALCLQGSVGRFVGPGQIQSSGTTGVIYLDLNLNAQPTPTGLVSVQPGETWNFQLWYRDAVAGQTTSNFSDAVGVSFL